MRPAATSPTRWSARSTTSAPASHVFVLEDVAPRPLAGLPASIAADMEHSSVSIFAAHAQTNELGSRMQMTDIVNRRRMRHAHMVNITDQIMCEGMRADFRDVDRHQHAGHRHRPPGADDSRDDAGGHRHARDAGSRTTAGSRRAA